MIPTMNLQLLTTLTTTSASDMTLAAPQAGEFQPLPANIGFAEWLGFQAGPGPAAAKPHGEFLPPGGNELPVPTPIPADALREPLIDLPLAADGELAAASAEFAFAAQWPADAPARPVAEAGAGAIDPMQPPGPATLPPGEPSVNVQPLPLSSGPGATSRAPVDAARPAMPAASQNTLPEAQGAVGPVPTQASAAPAAAPVQTQPPAPLPVERPVAQSGDVARVAESGVSAASGDGGRVNLLAEGQVVPRALPVAEITPQMDRPAPLQAPQPSPTPLPATSTSLAAALASADTTRITGSIPDATTSLIRTPVGEPGWGDRLGERVLLMAGNRKQQAEIRLTPADLGPVRIRIAMEDGAAHVTFQAQHAATREAIETAMPRLRDMLAENGVALGQTSVGGDSVAEGQRERPDASPATRANEAMTDDGEEAAPAERRYSVATSGLVDTFA